MLSKKYTPMFRISVTLNESVDEKILEQALRNVICRFPTFRYKLKFGVFWCYFKLNEGIPNIQKDYNNPMIRIDFKENNNFMFKVRYFEKRIAVEYFHALTDGYGGMKFILTLTAEYLRLKEKVHIQYNDIILNPLSKAKMEEYSDSFRKYYRENGALEKEKPAYHYKGTIEPIHILNVITGTIPIDKLKTKCKEYDCSITQFIVSTMLLSLQEMQEKEIKKQSKRKMVKVSIPVNLRNIYPTNTMRNFSSYINVYIDTKLGHYSFEEIITLVKSEMNLMLNEKRINAKISGNVKLEKNYFIRLIPMFVKKHIIALVERLMGDRYCSTTFSNLGIIEVPSELEKYIKEVGFMIGRSKGKPCASACVGYNNNLYITFSRRVKESEFERLFFTKLVQMDIPVEIESNMRR